MNRTMVKRAFCVILLSLSLAGLALAQQAAPGPAAKVNEGKANITAGETTITLSEVHAKKLERMRKLGVTVLYPTFVPDRFSLASATLTDNQDRRSFAYHLRFCDKRHLCFSIESGDVDEGVGDIATGNRRLKGQSESLGHFIIERYGNGGIRSEYLVWKAPKVRSWKGNRLSFSGTGVTDKEALAIVEFLALIE